MRNRTIACARHNLRRLLSSPRNWALLIIAVGIFNMVKPESAWYMEYGWRYKDAEPSDLALTVNRFAGGFAIFIGLIFLIS